MRVLLWHVHAAWMTAFVQGQHEYLVPVVPGRGPDGRGRAETYPWPDSVRELTPEQLRAAEIDAVVLQRPHELALLPEWTGRDDLPAVYVEHNTPRGDVDEWRHPLADRSDVPVVHVTEFNRMVWDTGRAPTLVIEHGVIDHGHRYTGSRDSLAVAVNEPVRRRRVAGMDLAERVATQIPVSVYGLQTGELGAPFTETADLSQSELHDRFATHLAYLHPYRWTSLGLSLVEAMTLGCPVLVNAATAAPESVPPSAGVVSSDPDVLARTALRWRADRDEARAVGLAARRHALHRFGLTRFLDDWDRVLKEVCR